MSSKSKILLFLQFFSLLILLLNFKIQRDYVSILLGFMGFLLSIWAVASLKIGNFNIQPEVKPSAKLIQKGPYRYCRNPIYAGLVMFFGSSVFSDPELLNLIFYFILILVLIFKINMEEMLLEKRFGQVYTDYKKKSFALIPGVW